MEIDPKKALIVLARWDNSGEDPEQFSSRVWADLVKDAQPDEEVWEDCHDETVRLMFSGGAAWVDNEIRRNMWPHEELHVKCNHRDHRVQVGVNFGRPRGKVQNA